MPRLSRRQQAIKAARKFFKRMLIVYIVLKDDIDDALCANKNATMDSSNSMLEDLLVLAYARLNALQASCYSECQLYRPPTYAVPLFTDDLHHVDIDKSGIFPWLNDSKFLQKYCMSRHAFWKLYSLIKDDDIFLPPPCNGKSQWPIAFQLMTCLKAFGEEGSGSSPANLRDVFATGYGTSIVYMQWVVHAIRNLHDKYVSWPDANERKLIAHRIHQSCGLPNCIGMVDGTLFLLTFKPNRTDHADFKGRKHGYSLSRIFVNDDRQFIRYYSVGWPGCTHDNRIAGNSQLWRTPNEFFAANEYIIGDSAFEVNWFILPAYSSPAGATMSDEHTLFNKQLSKARVISEHTIGLLKGRFPWLRSIRKNITENKNTLKEILFWLDACVILHNFLLEHRLELYEEDWIEDDDDSVIDDAHRRPSAMDELNLPVPGNRPSDFHRTQVLYFLQELYGV